MIELIFVMAIIIVLAGLVLGTFGYVQGKGATSRAEAEIKAMEAACESYKADNGFYPRDPSITDALDARPTSPTTFRPTDPKYTAASLFLYKALAGDSDADRKPETTSRSYMTFKPEMLYPTDITKPVQYIQDPFGNSYGYSTAGQTDPVGTKGYNPTFDLWSTAGTSTSAESAAKAKWIKNW